MTSAELHGGSPPMTASASAQARVTSTAENVAGGSGNAASTSLVNGARNRPRSGTSRHAKPGWRGGTRGVDAARGADAFRAALRAAFAWRTRFRRAERVR